MNAVQHPVLTLCTFHKK